MKFDFLKIISDYEHFVVLNLPVSISPLVDSMGATTTSSSSSMGGSMGSSSSMGSSGSSFSNVQDWQDIWG